MKTSKTNSNLFFQDTRLSWKAKGLFAYLLSMPEDYVIQQNELVKQSSDGVTAVRSAIEDLQKYGYIVKTQKHNSTGIYWKYEIISEPKIINVKLDKSGHVLQDNSKRK